MRSVRHRSSRRPAARHSHSRRAGARRDSLHALLPESGVPIRLDASTGPRLLAAVQGGNPVTSEQAWATATLWHDAHGSTAWRLGDLLAVDLPAERRVMMLAAPGAVLRPEDREALAALVCTRNVSFLPAPTAALIEPVVRECGLVLSAPSGDADHLLSALSLAELERWSGSRGKEIRRFDARTAARATVREGHLTDAWAHDHLVATFDAWATEKFGGIAAAPTDLLHEYRGMLRWTDEIDPSALRLFCLEVDGAAAGVSVIQPFAQERVWMAVLMKALPSVAGAGLFLRRHVARAAVSELGATAVWNAQQDDDLPQLRDPKLRARPIGVQRKFAVARPLGAP